MLYIIIKLFILGRKNYRHEYMHKVRGGRGIEGSSMWLGVALAIAASRSMGCSAAFLFAKL